MGMAWTDKMVEDLKIMWKQGLTTGEIGKRLGVSKNSIVGKVHRLQLDARPSPIKKKVVEVEEKAAPIAEKACGPKPKKETKLEKQQVRDEIEANRESKIEKIRAQNCAACPPHAPKSTTYSGKIGLTELDNHTCRWPIGDPKDDNFHFCGKKIRVGQTYCEEHSAMAYVKPNKK